MGSAMGDSGPTGSPDSQLDSVAGTRPPHVEARPPVSVLPDWKRDLARKFSPLTALITGMIAVLAVRFAQFHINGTALVSADPELTMAIEAGVAILLSVIVMLMMPFQAVLTKLGYLAGMAIAIVGMHNAVHAAPPVFSLLFSQEWTDQVIAATAPSSIYMRGDTILLALPVSESKEKKMPTVLRLN